MIFDPCHLVHNCVITSNFNLEPQLELSWQVKSDPGDEINRSDHEVFVLVCRFLGIIVKLFAFNVVSCFYVIQNHAAFYRIRWLWNETRDEVYRCF